MSIYNDIETQRTEVQNNPESELFEKMKFLYPDLTLKDFEEELEREGFHNLNHRINQNLKSRYDMIQKYGDDGKGVLRKLNELDQNGVLDQINRSRREELRRWNHLLGSMDFNKEVDHDET